MNPLWDLVVEAEAKFGPQPAMHTETRTYSFSEVKSIAANIAAELRAAGLRKGDLVATLLPNGFDWLVTLAASHEGLLSVSLHHIGQAADLGAALVVAVPERRGVQTTTVPILNVDDKWLRARENYADATPPREFDGEKSLVRLVLTSGTTGKAKAAEYNAGTIKALSASAAEVLGHGGSSRLSFMGFSSMGGVYQALAHMTLGTPYVAIGALTTRLPELIDELEISVLVGATVSLAQVCDVFEGHPESGTTIKRIIIAGSTPSDALINRLAERFPGAGVAIMYGSTEGGLIAVKEAAVGSEPRIVGHVVPNVEVTIVDINGQLLEHGEVGEIRYRSPEVIERYYRDPESTKESIRDGWFYPGDRGMFTPAHELMIVGRVDDVMNIGGVKVDPLALESAALAVPGVTDAACYLVDTSDGKTQIEMALVVDADETMKVVDSQIRDASPSAVPAVYRRVSSLPHNQMGKLIRDGLAQFVADSSR